MQLLLLGPLELRVGGRVVPLRSGLPRRLLVVLALRLGERVSTDTLIEAVWGQHTSQAAGSDKLNALQVLVSYLRKVLAATEGAAAIETVEGGYRLMASPADVDVHRLAGAVTAAGHLTDPEQRLEQLEAALAAWRGSPIPEVAAEPFAQADLQRLNELRLAASELRMDALLALGRNAQAAAELQHLVVVHPLRERFHAQLMTALYRSGRQAEALGVYERARTLLVEELGLDPGPELRSLEQAILRHTLQVSAPPREQQAPAVLPPRVRSSAPLEPLIGRESELARLTELAAGHRLITLIGPGGAGKTRLATELADRSGAVVWWVDLSSLPEGDGVLGAVAAATGVSSRPDDETAVVGHLANQQGLLVLDTCERVRGELRRLVESVLRTCPDVSVLATSRKPLGAATELVWPVPPLSLPDTDSATPDDIGRAAAVRLFVERAAQRRPGFELTPENCADIARVCLLLDGLPLAIELAAGHAALLPPAAMVRVLDDRLRLLVDDTREGRQHTLRSTIAWSYEVLSEDERTFFDRLSAFAGPFGLDEAVAVAGDGLARDGVELLLALAQQSLVAGDGAGRFRLLDTVRAFAAERLAADEGELRATRRRHAAWYVELLGGRLEGWRGGVRDALPELRIALDWCFGSAEEELGARMLASLWWLWPREGVVDEAAAWFPRAKALVPHGSELQAGLLASAGTYALTRGDLAAAGRDCGTAAQVYEKLGYKRSLAQTLIGLGVAHWGRGDHVRAAAAHERATEIFGDLGDAWGVGLCLVLRARTAVDAGEPDARRRLDDADAAARLSGDDHVLANVLVQRAQLAIADGHWEDAQAAAEASLRLNEEHGHHEGSVGSLHVLALAQTGRGQLDAAERTLARALRAATALHHVGATAESIDCLAVLASRQQRWYDAAVLLARGEALRERSGINRSAVTTRLVRVAETATRDHLRPADLARAREEAVLAGALG